MNKLKNLITNISFSQSRLAIPLIMSSIVGIVTGLAMVLFIRLTEVSHQLFFVSLLASIKARIGPMGIILVPALGGLLVGFLTVYIFPAARPNGISEVLKAIALKSGKIPVTATIGKLLASALSIGTGASTGREGPAVQIGAGLGSLFAKVFQLREVRVKNLVACGTAAGIAAVFNAPITGVMFAQEIILRDFGAKALSTVVVASVAASIVSRMFLGDTPAFAIPVYKMVSPYEIFLYLCLGILAAFVALAFMKIDNKTEYVFEKWKRCPLWLKPAIGGLVVGGLGLFVPNIFGMGFETIEGALHGQFDIKMLLLFMIFKMLATPASLSSGASGGTFAPILFIGACFGAAFGQSFQGRVPFDLSPAGAYAVVGMASVFSAAFHAPVTAILLIFEMTGDYRLILPIMIASVVSVSISQLIQRESIEGLKLKSQGIDPDIMEEIRVLGALQVRDAMTKEYETVSRRMPVRELIDRMTANPGKVFLMVNAKNVAEGIIHPRDVQELYWEKDLAFLLAVDVAAPLREHCLPDEPLSEVARLMTLHHVSEIPVMDPADFGKVVGILRSDDVFNAYTHLSTKRDDLISRAEDRAGTVQLRFDVSHRSGWIGKKLRDVQIPDGVVLTSLERRKRTKIPDGNTEFQTRDKIWAIVLSEKEMEVRKWLAENNLTQH